MSIANGLALGSIIVFTAARPSAAASPEFEKHHLQTLHGAQPNSSFGAAVANAGDVNGDGWPDLVVGAPDHDGAAGPNCGKAFLFYGSATGYVSSPGWSAEGERPDARFGRAVASAGDVNNDGFDDVVIGSPEYSFPYYWNIIPGRLYVYLGAADGLSPTPVLLAEGGYDDRPYDGIGGVLATGDFNGDNYADVVAAQYSRYVGGATVFYGSASGPSLENATKIGGLHAGNSVAVADVNGDRFDDLVLTRTHVQPASGYVGAVIHYGSPLGLETRVAHTFDQWFYAAAAGDVDLDGYDDLWVGEGDPTVDFMLAHVFYRGSPSGPLPTEAAPVQVTRFYNVPASRFDTLGDINGDGFVDAMADDGSFFYLYLGTESGYYAVSDGMERKSSAAFAAAGDLNRDGLGDILRGEPAEERVDVYGGATDWRLRVVADFALDMVEQYGPSWSISVTNNGPDHARARVVDVFPRSAGNVPWTCDGEAIAKCGVPFSPVVFTGPIFKLVLPGRTNFWLTLPLGFLPVVNTATIVLPDWVTDPDLSNNSETVIVGFPRQPIFSDGFESGTLSAWSEHSGDGLAVSSVGRLEGRFSLRATPRAAGSVVVRDDTPDDERSYHARFRVDTGGLARFKPPFAASIFVGHTKDNQPLFDIGIQRRGDRLMLIARTLTNAGATTELPALRLSRAHHVIDVGWRRSMGSITNDGLFTVRLDDGEAVSLSTLANDTVGGVDSVELGLTVRAFRPPRLAHADLVLDSFASWRVASPTPITAP